MDLYNTLFSLYIKLIYVYTHTQVCAFFNQLVNTFTLKIKFGFKHLQFWGLFNYQDRKAVQLLVFTNENMSYYIKKPLLLILVSAQ